MAPEAYPYLDSRQLVGLLTGMRGAAEYEQLIDAPGDGLPAMTGQSFAHLFILILIAWLTKIFLHANAPINDLVSFYQALRIGHIPSWMVALIFAGTFITVISLTIYVSKKSSGEISEFGTHRSLWRI